MASDLSREINIEELEARYLKHVESRLEYIQSALGSPEYLTKARTCVETLIEFKSRIDSLRKKAIAGKLTLGEAIQHFKTEPKKRKPRRRKILTRYERVIKNFL